MTVQNRRPARRTFSSRRTPWYILTGLLLGITLGIAYAWLISPIQYLDTEPASLQSEFKDQYRALIAAAYSANSDLARAQARLALLEDPNMSDTLAAQAQRALADGHPAEEVRALAQLALIANAPPASIPTAAPLTQFPTPSPSVGAGLTPLPTETPLLLPTETPAETLTPTPTPQPIDTEEVSTDTTPETGTPGTPTPPTPIPPSRTPTLTPNTPTLAPTSLSPFILDQRTLLCDPDIIGPLLIVQTLEDNDIGIPGIEIILNWSGGEEHFFTGLKPELGLGYADFAMTPDITYTLRLADGSQLITDLTATQCEADNGQTIWGSWELIFIQP